MDARHLKEACKKYTAITAERLPPSLELNYVA